MTDNITQKINWKAEIDPVSLYINRYYEEDYKGFHFEVRMRNSLYNKDYTASIKMRISSNKNDSGKEIFNETSNSSSRNDPEKIDRYIDKIQEKIINELTHTKEIIDACLRDVEIEGFNKNKSSAQSSELNNKTTVKIRKRKTINEEAIAV